MLSLKKVKLKKLVMILCIIATLLLISILCFEKYKVNKWTNGLLIPDGITMRDKFDSPLIAGTDAFEGEKLTYDKASITKIADYIKTSVNKRSCSEKEAYSFNTKNIKFTIGTVWVVTKTVPDGSLGSVNIFKDGTFIAQKSCGLKKFQYIKGKLSKEALDYLDNVYKNASDYK